LGTVSNRVIGATSSDGFLQHKMHILQVAMYLMRHFFLVQKSASISTTLDSSRSTPRTSYFRHTNKHFSGPGRAVGTNHRMTQVGWLGPRSAGHFALDLHSSNDYGHHCNIVVNNDIGIMRSHRTHCIDATYCYRCRTYRGLSVCESVSVCWTRE